jgi:chitin disaccharide deacetylase
VDVIVNADDLGMSVEVNGAILSLASRYLVTSSTLMANGPAFKDAIEQIHRYPHCSFGIHLNATEFQPLTTNAALKRALDARGNFRKENMHLPMGIALMRAIYAEWCAQIEKARAHGVNISHIDSHDHIHARKPQLLFYLKRIQKKYNIPKIRISKNIYSSSHPIKSKALYYKKMIFNYLIKMFHPAITTSGFTDFTTFLEAAKLNKIPHDSVELMVHPGNPKPEFVEETALLQNWRLDEIPFAINLINYHELLN